MHQQGRNGPNPQTIAYHQAVRVMHRTGAGVKVVTSTPRVKAIISEILNSDGLTGTTSASAAKTANSAVVSSTTNHKSNVRLTPNQLTSLRTGKSTSNSPGASMAMVSSKKSSMSSNQSSVSRRRKSDKVNKGLRHFSMKVCEKVKEKGTTTYNEVADELVAEVNCRSQDSSEVRQPVDPANFDQKNIRRRVYDALNVLMAMNIISKEKKEIRWIGLPTNSVQQCSHLENENQKRRERIEEKRRQLRDLIMQQVSFKSLVTRNKEAEERGLIPTPSSAIQLPFIIVNTHKKTHINCSISHDKSEYFFKFNDKFEIHDDVEVLKRMGLLLGLDKGECSQENIERAKEMVPKAFERYIELYGRGHEDSLSDDFDVAPADFSVVHRSSYSNNTDDNDDDDDDEEDDDFAMTDGSDAECD